MGVGVFAANRDVGVTRDASALAVDIFMKRRRSIEAYSACRASVPDGIGVSKKRPTMVRDATPGCENNRHRYGGPNVAN